ncbi:hypothetical protein JCM8097_008459 [Rhodosporidiobolus ruineniae]
MADAQESLNTAVGTLIVGGAVIKEDNLIAHAGPAYYTREDYSAHQWYFGRNEEGKHRAVVANGSLEAFVVAEPTTGYSVPRSAVIGFCQNTVARLD